MPNCYYFVAKYDLLDRSLTNEKCVIVFWVNHGFGKTIIISFSDTGLYLVHTEIRLGISKNKNILLGLP